MKIKLFGSDLDGTMIYNNKISDANIKALKLLIEKGVIPVFITGRLHTSARYFCDLYDLKIPIIGNNGAIVLSEDDELLNCISLKDSDAEFIANICDQKNIYYHFYDYDTFYSKSLWLKRIKHLTVNGNDPYSFHISLIIAKDALSRALNRGKGITKFVIKDPEGLLKDIFIEKGLEVTKSSPYTIEVMQKNVSKYNGIKILADRYKINMNEIATIGDYDNDISMIQNAGFGIAMGNALDSVKKVADYITDDLESDGVAKAINYMFEKGII